MGSINNSIVFFNSLSRTKKTHLLKTKHKILVVVHSFSPIYRVESIKMYSKK